HTRFSRDWSSDVCSSDLISHRLSGPNFHRTLLRAHRLYVGNPHFCYPIDCPHNGSEVHMSGVCRLFWTLACLFLFATALWAEDKIGRASCRERVCVVGIA